MSEGGEKKVLMDKEAAARIQKAEAKQNDGKIEKGGWPAKAQAQADKNVNEGLVPPPGGDK